jgi:hypothetical protein
MLLAGVSALAMLAPYAIGPPQTSRGRPILHAEGNGGQFEPVSGAGCVSAV